ncbi:MAG: sulfurtransferase TusA family protein [Promethearchaeota archaeon]
MSINKLDTSGAACPMPAFRTKKALAKLEPGDILVVTGDFIEAVENIVRIVNENNAKVINKEINDATFRIEIEKI